ncbi:MAG: hypothetical protein ACKO2G_10225 [Verrucomicrobiales bacterium]
MKRAGLHYTPFSEKAPAISRAPARQTGEKSHFLLPVAKVGLVRDDENGAAIAIEVWELDPSQFGEFVAAIPAPLGIGKVQLDDGSEVPGFIAEPRATNGATEITSFGGWRAWLESR